MTPAELAEMEAICFSGTLNTWSESQFRSHLENPNGITISDEAGFIVGRVAADEAELLTLGILPAMRRKGHGGRLLRSFEVMAAKMGAKEAFLEVAANNAAAIALYSRHGFQQVGCRRDYYSRGRTLAVNANIMRKSLER